MKTFYAICVAVILVLVLITMTIRSESTSFYGIADAQEVAINDEFAVEIRKVHVIPGQHVKVGDTLLEVNTPELDLKIAELNSDLGENRSEQAVLVNQLRGEIRELETQLATNRKLVSELRSIKKSDAGEEKNTGIDNPIAVRIQQLKKALQLALDSQNITMKKLSSKSSFAREDLAEPVSGTQRELEILLEAKKQSAKLSPITGVVGVICFKEGEKVSPFTPICSLHTESPSFVRGYIHENIFSQIVKGQSVKVTSLANKKNSVAGEVTGVGARIVEYPVRLRKSPEMLMWGREVMIKIPAGNTFLLGEKVMISVDQHTGGTPQSHGWLHLCGTAYAAEPAPSSPLITDQLSSLADITFPQSSKTNPAIEASGALYCADLNKFLVISDDTEQKKPVLYLMRDAGTIEKEVTITGLEAINDLEAIAQGEGTGVYLLTSQSYTAKGELPKTRRLFIKVAREADRFTLLQSLSLTDALQKVAQENPAQAWARFVTSAITGKSLDIEGLAIRKGTALLGFKGPLLNGSAIVLAIDNIDALFAGKTLQADAIHLYRQLTLHDPQTKTPCGISDLLYVGERLYGLATGQDNGTDIGLFWVCDSDTTHPRILQRFNALKPEGIALDPNRHTMLITFDNGSKHPSQFLTLKVD